MSSGGTRTCMGAKNLFLQISAISQDTSAAPLGVNVTPFLMGAPQPSYPLTQAIPWVSLYRMSTGNDARDVTASP